MYYFFSKGWEYRIYISKYISVETQQSSYNISEYICTYIHSVICDLNLLFKTNPYVSFFHTFYLEKCVGGVWIK